MLDQAVMERHFYKLWRKIGGTMTVQDKYDVMTDGALAMTFIGAYETGKPYGKEN